MRVNSQQPTRNIQPNIGWEIQTKVYKKVRALSSRLTFSPWILDISCWLLVVEISKDVVIQQTLLLQAQLQTT